MSQSAQGDPLYQLSRIVENDLPPAMREIREIVRAGMQEIARLRKLVREAPDLVLDRLSERARWAVRVQDGAILQAPGWLSGAIEGVREAHEVGLITKDNNNKFVFTDLGREVASLLRDIPAPPQREEAGR